QRYGKASEVNRSGSPEFPLGFSPNSKCNSLVPTTSHKQQDGNSNIQTGFSMIKRLEEIIEVGLAFVSLKICRLIRNYISLLKARHTRTSYDIMYKLGMPWPINTPPILP
ncbi:hypothetical protein Tco_0279815, partial [Tanacetum coccineum]